MNIMFFYAFFKMHMSKLCKPFYLLRQSIQQNMLSLSIFYIINSVYIVIKYCYNLIL